MIKLIEFILLGIVQGFTEPIPVSSSGHLFIIQTILEKINASVQIDFDLLATTTNFGSFLAILIFFWKDIIKLVNSFFSYIFKKNRTDEVKADYKYCWLIVLATIPAGIMGLVVTKMDLFAILEENAKFIGVTLLITSLFLYLIKDFKGKKKEHDITVKDAVIIGFAQMIALIPGISRSGATIVGGMFRDLKRTTAFNFSFILYIPISVATTVLGIKDLIEMGFGNGEWIYYIVATVLAGVFTYITTKWFSKIVKEGKMIYFSIYCFAIGLLVILFL